MNYILYLILVINSELYEVKKVLIMKDIDCIEALDTVTTYKKDVGYFYNNKLVMGYSCENKK
jgi:hypothetical protein